jgi:FkbM family methyltransferase
MTINDFFYPFGVELKRISGKYRYLKLFSKYQNGKRHDSCAVNLDGNHFFVPDCPSFAWQIKEIFAEESYFFESDSDHPIILDVGANIGVSVLWFKRRYPSSIIYAIEADPAIFDILKKNVGHLPDVHLYQKAAWISNEVLSFQADGADGGTLITDNEAKNEVQGIRLKDFICEFQRIDFLKIDIEGAESDVLHDCCDVLQHVDNIFIEYHSFNKKPQSFDEILCILTKNGFRYYIKNVGGKRKNPFINKNIKQRMDMQIEISGYRL